VSASGPACFDSGILVVVSYNIILCGDRFARCHCRKRPSITKRVYAFAAAQQWRLSYIMLFFSSPSRRRCIIFVHAVFGVWWAVRINITRARDEYRLKTAAPSCVCVCVISARSLLCTLLLRLLLYFAVCCRQRLCVRVRATGDAQMTFTGLIELEPLTVGGGGWLSCKRAVYRLTSRISPSPPKVRHPARDLSCVGTPTTAVVFVFSTMYYVFTMIIII